VRIGRRFKRQGAAGVANGAEHLAQLLWLQNHPTDWTHCWSKTALSKVRVNPGWSSCALPSNWQLTNYIRKNSRKIELDDHLRK